MKFRNNRHILECQVQKAKGVEHFSEIQNFESLNSLLENRWSIILFQSWYSVSLLLIKWIAVENRIKL